MNFPSAETSMSGSKQLLGGYGSVAHLRVASLQCFGAPVIVATDLAGWRREESGTCCFVEMPPARAKKVFGILRKFARGSRAVRRRKSRGFNPPFPKNDPITGHGLFVFNFEILRGNAADHRRRECRAR